MAKKKDMKKEKVEKAGVKDKDDEQLHITFPNPMNQDSPTADDGGSPMTDGGGKAPMAGGDGETSQGRKKRLGREHRANRLKLVWKSQRHVENWPKHAPQTRNLAKRQQKLMKLMVPFPEASLAQNAQEALELLEACPAALNAEVLIALVEEIALPKIKQGVDHQYGMGFGQQSHKPVTSEWSRWATFTGDRETWPGTPHGVNDGWTQYTTKDRDNRRRKREYSTRVAVVVTILDLVYQDLTSSRATAVALKELHKENPGVTKELANQITKELVSEEHEVLGNAKDRLEIKEMLTLFERTLNHGTRGKRWHKLKSHFIKAGKI